MKNELSILNRHQKSYPGYDSSNALILNSQGYELATDLTTSTIHEQCRALIAKTALDNLGALSNFAEHLSITSPYGEKQYQQILNAYAFGAAKKLWRW